MRLRRRKISLILPRSYQPAPPSPSDQKQAKDAKPGAGHQQRYVTGERQPIIAEDRDGTGFACEQYYEVHIGECRLAWWCGEK